MVAGADTAAEPSLNEKHLKYWTMCLQYPLPQIYLANESNRMALAYFIVNSISILTPSPSPSSAQPQPPPLISPVERRALREWVLSHQHAAGGFCGTSSLLFPLRDYEEWDFEEQKPTPEHSGLANIAATVFSLLILALLADDDEAELAFNGVDRVKTLRWLRKLQREDGSFGESLMNLPGRGWFVGGGYDGRYCYIATVIRWILRGDLKEGELGWVEDFDTERLAKYILNSQTYDGGFAGSSADEPHAGYAYCAISALSLLDRPQENSIAAHPSKILHSRIRDMPGLIHWLASRQFVYLKPKERAETFDEDDDPVNYLLPEELSDLTLDENIRHVGFNGRSNKVADTCYCWWVGAALANLGKVDMIDQKSTRRFLLERMQHKIGGFGKFPGSPPDVYHACFGTAILAVMGEPGLKECDSSLAIPVDAVRRIERARRALLKRANEEGQPVSLASEILDMGLSIRGEKPAWLTVVEG
ncbi:terpenoid cyclases/protein prenyltransferase alpha-alpha toroid [Podospora didyma]|uniref:Terpenoid cyclases/protein prenyltransferase alpha-alpha toroid n=1 Tax=Podospora didyma TaxID=330526 RepID=A0AAE0NNT4_9PEZI|nr:terpenoid cyclases/protein prenyltransferase alpha-alpha toroid [Podospora didyma]